MISPKDRNVPRRIPIRLKLAAALAVPICALLLVSVLEVAQSASDASTTEEQTQLATASIGPGGVITALQDERNFGSVYLLGFEEIVDLPVASFDEATAATDDAIATFRADIEAKGGDVARTYASALDGLDAALEEQRTAFTEYDGPRNQENQAASDPFFTAYTGLIDGLFAANGQAALAIDDPTLRRGVEQTDLATHQIEHVARLTRVLLLAGLDGGVDEAVEISEAAGLLGQVEDTLEQIHDLGLGRYEPATAKVEEEFNASGFLDIAAGAIENTEVPITDLMASLSRADDEGFNGFRMAVNDEITQRADELNADAGASQRRYIGLALLAVVVAGLVTWLVSRSITRPLRSLTQQAKEMAEHRLPEAVTDILDTPLGDDVVVPTVTPVRVATRDEVADVADALNTVQDSALDLAVEQAVLRRNIADSFVNLGRRNQNLLGRQLDFITELETNETSPDALANLFRLDHLATRMRRNAESLLVLAGIEPPRQWAAPVRLTDVIRAALGEVEDYQRVTVRGVEPATILGSAAADLAHLLAELIENALVFSPPDQSVDIRGRNRPASAAEGSSYGPSYTLAIIDSGLGMPAGDVAAANRRLAGAESFTIAPSKYLGHYVAGNLAARHDIRVHLDNSPGNGITATIDIPPHLLTTDAELVAPLTPPHGTGAVTDAIVAPQASRPQLPRVAAAAPPGLPWADLGDAGEPVDAPPPPPVLDPATPAWSPAPTAAPDMPALPTRTASGLVKRARRGPEQAPAAAMPDGELLASLSSVAGNHASRPPVPPPAPVAHGGDPAGPARPGAARTSGAVPPADGGSARTRSWPAPPGARTGGPAPDGNGTGPALPPLPSRGGNGHAPDAGRNGPADSDPGATPGGLARRVRGAQLPVSQPLNLRRNQETPSGGDGGYRLDDQHNANGHMLGSGNTDGHISGQPNGTANGNAVDGRSGTGVHDESNAARSVYGFLTSFTQGVQRGLEEVRRDPNTPKENS